MSGNNLNQKIKNLREALGLTRKEFAKRLNVSVSTISRWESGERIPNLYHLKKIIEVFRVKPEHLLK